jgi:hypothetical protein
MSMSWPEPNEDRVVALLEALLSEQRAMAARQAEAIESQRRAIEVQIEATRRASRILTSLLFALAVVILAAYFGPYIAVWLVHR